MMPRPATCSVVASYPGGGSQALPAQTAAPAGGGGYAISWAFTVPAATPTGEAVATGTCRYAGQSLPQSVIGFTIQP
jgi:hypothetical protein